MGVLKYILRRSLIGSSVHPSFQLFSTMDLTDITPIVLTLIDQIDSLTATAAGKALR